jgi:hypothetical protein
VRTQNESKKRERKAKAKELRALKVEIEKLHKSVARERRKTESIDRELATKIEPDSSDTEGEAAKESAKNVCLNNYIHKSSHTALDVFVANFCARPILGYGLLQLNHTGVNQLEFTLGSFKHPKPYKMTVFLHSF